MAEVFDVYLAKADQPESEVCAELSLPATPYQMQDAFDKLRLAKDEPLYWEITEYRQFEELSSVLNDTCGLYDLNALAQRLSELTEPQRTAFAGLLAIEQRKNQPIPVVRLIDLAYSTVCCHVVDEALNDSQLGRFLAENCFISGMETMPDSLFDLLDFEKIGRDHREAAGGVLVRRSMGHSGGYVERHSELRQVSKTLPLTPKKPAYIILAETYDGSRVEFPFPANAPMGTEIVRCVDCAVPLLIGLTGGMEAVDLLARRLAGMEPQNLTAYKALLNAAGCEDLSKAASLIDELDQYTFCPEYGSASEVAKGQLHLILGEREAEMLLPHLDLNGYGKDLIQYLGGVVTPYGFLEKRENAPTISEENQPQRGGMEMM